ncbi:uncharacterized protein LOC119609048 [Lucilia sericata]|uniref:uncharacterized protein LOC119609048 n=1 Tax=Lucilia sericata TaxID=13632 RepID=UPI0018A83D59|nr:uncharacterized protein LOC119609048 [Lucilia sericata]
MYTFNKIIIFLIKIAIVISAAYDPIKQKSFSFSTNITPEIAKEFKDFETLIPTATIDAIVAEHYLVDGNFRTAIKYLRSQEFTKLQRQLFDIPEIIDILEFLHLTSENATTRHMGATKTTTTAAVAARVKASLNDYNDAVEVDNRVDKMTTNTGTIIISKRNTMAIENAIESSSSALNKNIKVHKRPQQLQMERQNNRNVAIDDNDVVVARISNERQPLVSIVLLEDLKVKGTSLNEGHHNQHHYHHHKYQRHQSNNNYHHHHHRSLGTFTAFVEEVLQHLPHSAYQNMIKDKCLKNAKFAEFYRALRSLELKPLIDQAMTSENIKKIIQTLDSHKIDVKALEPIAFKVISWGPNI